MNFWTLTRLPCSEASTYLPIYSKEIFFVNFSFFAKNVPIFIVFREKFQKRKMCSTNCHNNKLLKILRNFSLFHVETHNFIGDYFMGKCSLSQDKILIQIDMYWKKEQFLSKQSLDFLKLILRFFALLFLKNHS